MPNFVHLCAHRMTPSVAVDAHPEVNIGIRNSIHPVWWQAIHNMVCQLSRRTHTKVLVESRLNILKRSLRDSDSRDSIADTSFISVVSTGQSPVLCLLNVELSIGARCVLCGNVDQVRKRTAGKRIRRGSSGSIIFRDDSNNKNLFFANHSKLTSLVFFLVISADEVEKVPGMSWWDETFRNTTLGGTNKVAFRHFGLPTLEFTTFHFLFPESSFFACNQNDVSVIKLT